MKALRVQGTLQAIEPVVKFAVQAAEEAGLDDKDTFRIRLAVDELATNIIMHGYLEAGRSGDIVVSSEVADDQLLICLEDNGATHDPRHTPPPNLNAPLEERPLGGLGIYLALWAVDQFHYEHDQNVNRSVLVLERPCPSFNP
ncbi:MAG: anti-sigma regulatory factor [Ardenticatenaceae bacterium]|nr:anti-sigma regulatory factor [Ardenticatenaceae bacterium]